MKKLLSGLLLSVTLSLSAQAADYKALQTLFKKEFYTHYESAKCQFNTRKFVVRAWKKDVDIRGALFLQVTGYGSINYYYGRSGGSSPSGGAWFHHYALIVPTDNKSDSTFSPDRNYVVIDFDFGNSPRVVDFKTYIEEQFIPKYLHGNDEKIRKNFDLGLMKFTAFDVNRLVSHIDETGDLSYSLEKSAAEFTETKLRDLYFKLK